MKVKVIANYFDTQLKRSVNIGEELTVDERRAEILINAKVAEEVIDAPTTTPKR